MKYYIIAGEASGDLHASNLMAELKKNDVKAEFRCWGGDLMQHQGGNLVKHYREMAFMGLLEVVMNIRTINKNIQLCKEDIAQYRPDALILVDYAGFNLRIAEFASRFDLKIFYYISPKIWAWKKNRALKVKQYVDKMFVIFPFEIEFYQQYDYNVDYVGNPLVDAIAQKSKKLPDKSTFIENRELDKRPIIALLAGSRKQEISLLLPEMLKVAEHFPAYQFIIAGAPSIDKDFYEKYTAQSNVKLIYDQTYALLSHANAALVTSGTATLETALFNVPQVVSYKTSAVTYHIGKFIVDVKYFSLVNIIMDKEVVKELLQFNLAEEMKNELERILFDITYRNQMLENYKIMRKKLGSPGASARTARLIYEYLKNDKENTT